MSILRNLTSMLGISMVSLLGQTYDIVRIDGRPLNHIYDTGDFDPIIDVQTFSEVGLTGSGARDYPSNINGPSLIRLPDWLADEDRVHPDANYYLYFAHHRGTSIRMAWASELTGTWKLFNYGTATDQAWGSSGNNTGEQTQGDGVLSLATVTIVGAGPLGLSDHVASPDVFIDDINERFVMSFHGVRGRNGGVFYGPAGQQTLVATSSNGLNFNDAAEYGQTGHGPRHVFPNEFYARPFPVSAATFAYSNTGVLWKAPELNTAGEPNTVANADSPGGFWNPDSSYNSATDHWWEEVASADNPIHQLYGSGLADPRHFAILKRDHIDPADQNAYVFYSAREDSPESIFLTVLDTNNGSQDSADWSPIGQRIIVEPELDWEGIDQPLGVSQNGGEIDVRQVRDPAVFEDDMGTATTADDKLYLLYTGEGEEAIGIAQLIFDPTTPNTAAPQGDLFPEANSGAILLDYNGNIGTTQTGYLGVTVPGTGNGLSEPSASFTNPFGGGDVSVAFSADRWKVRSALSGDFSSENDLLADYGGPVTGASATLTLGLPAELYTIRIYQHESARSAAETASLIVQDSDGLRSAIALESSFGSNPQEITVTTHHVRSDGVADVLLTIDNSDSSTTGAYPINGLEIYLASLFDSDGDDLPDFWEAANGLDSDDDSDRDEDDDSDGYSNFEEWISLTDPSDGQSLLELQLERSGEDLTFTFESHVGRRYSILHSVDLGQTDPWTAVIGPLAGLGGSELLEIPITVGEAEMFYQLLVEMP